MPGRKRNLDEAAANEAAAKVARRCDYLPSSRAQSAALLAAVVEWLEILEQAATNMGEQLTRWQTRVEHLCSEVNQLKTLLHSLLEPLEAPPTANRWRWKRRVGLVTHKKPARPPRPLERLLISQDDRGRKSFWTAIQLAPPRQLSELLTLLAQSGPTPGDRLVRKMPHAELAKVLFPKQNKNNRESNNIRELVRRLRIVFADAGLSSDLIDTKPKLVGLRLQASSPPAD